MQIAFKEQTPAGEVEFNGELNKEEVDFLLQYAIMALLQKGVLPMARDPMSVIPPPVTPEGAPVPQ